MNGGLGTLGRELLQSVVLLAIVALTVALPLGLGVLAMRWSA